jgi:hypothetical protein
MDTLSLSPSNRYSYLEVEEIDDASEDDYPLQAVPTPEPPRDKKPHLQKWE